MKLWILCTHHHLWHSYTKIEHRSDQSSSSNYKLVENAGG